MRILVGEPERLAIGSEGSSCERHRGIHREGLPVPFTGRRQDLGTHGRPQRGERAFRFALSRSGESISRRVRDRRAIHTGHGFSVIRFGRWDCAFTSTEAVAVHEDLRKRSLGNSQAPL